MIKNNAQVFLLISLFVLTFSTNCFAVEKNKKAVGDSPVLLNQAISVSSGHVRETIPGTTISSAYMTLTNNSKEAVDLVSVEGSVSNKIEMHEHTMENGMMRMGKVEEIAIEAHSSVTLEPYGLHIMIFDVAQPLKDSSSVDLILYFSDNTQLAITLPVQSIKNNMSNE